MICRGDIYIVDFPTAGKHPEVIVTRQEAIPLLSSITVVLITSTVRHHLAEVTVDESNGLKHEAVANCDNIFTVSKIRLLTYCGSLGETQIRELDTALSLALGLELIR